ncbi:MAG TPA: oligosaccharide flippase family protein [Anaerolineae bacterium]|nr:oligosaccharide flippase family protein [Anaerolineae bacterium]
MGDYDHWHRAQGMSIARRAIRGTIFVLVSSYANMGMGIIYGIIMARLLDPDHFGVFALGMFFFTLLDVRGKLGLDYAFIHRHRTTDQLIATHWLLQLAASTLTLILVVVAAAIVSRLDYPAATTPIMIALAGTMIIEATGTTARAALEKELVFARSTIVVTGSLFLSYIAAIALAAKGYAYWALVGQVAVNAALGSVGFWWAYRRLGQRPSIRFSFDRAIAGWLLRFGATLALGSIAIVVLLQFDNFLVGTFVGAAALGYYAQAYKVAQWPTGLVTHIVARASLPTYAKLQDDPIRLGKAFDMSLWLILTLALPIALAIFASAPDFLRLLWGDKWLPSASLLRFLIGYSVLRPLLDDTGALFVATGQPKRVTILLAVQAATLAILATPLTLAFGAIGTAIGVGVAFTVGIAVAYAFVSRTISIDLVRIFLPPAIACAGSLALYFAFADWIDLNTLPLLARVLVKGGIAAGVFFAILLALRRGEMFFRIRYIWNLLRGGAA